VTTFAHTMPFGAEALGDAGTRFRLWAPGAKEVDVEVTTSNTRLSHPMRHLGGGWRERVVAEARPGARYAFRIDGGLTVPDPASRSNPEDVHAPSEVIDPRAFVWPDDGWRGRPWEDAVIYELHVGTFTPAGTLAAVADRLDYLVDLGVTAVELMPLADFPGRRNWGYDGVLPFAIDTVYGRPDDLKGLVVAAHARGLMVFLDVVYNHFGPEGNYLHAYAPQFFNPKHQTPWGAAINYDGDQAEAVRAFYIHNALFWLEEYRLDGLRLDAVHAIADDSRPDIIGELTAAVQEGPGRDRHVHIILENDANQARHLGRDRERRPLRATAQWNDDVHHAVHVIVTGERDGYYADYAHAPLAMFGRTLAEGFGFQGEPSAYRGGEQRGEPSVHLPATAFIDFVQTHDQVGNRAFGDRIGAIADPDALHAALACVLLAPSVPMLFMGEEFNASSPFQFFCDFGPELAAAVRDGRRGEFGQFERFRDPAVQATIPDPTDEATFLRSKLDWSEVEAPGHLEWFERYRTLLGLRARYIAPRLSGMAPSGGYEVIRDAGLAVNWTLGDGTRLHHVANLSAAPLTTLLPDGEVIYASHPAPGTGPLRAWSVVVLLEAASG
jgi:malto-oligosyltrehalose trehalohydrolase